MACRMVLVNIPNRIPGIVYVVRLRVVGSQNLPIEGSLYYKTTTENVVRFEGIPDNYYEVGISMINESGLETAVDWQPVASYEIGLPILTSSGITGTGFTVNFNIVVGATGYEYSVNYGPWVSLGVSTPIVLTGLTAGKVYQIEVRAISSGRRGYSSVITVLTTPGHGNPIFYVERLKTIRNGGLIAYGYNRLVIANALKTVGQVYTLTNGFNLSSKTVGGGDSYETVAAALSLTLDRKSQIDAAAYSFVDFRDYTGSGSSEPSFTFAVT